MSRWAVLLIGGILCLQVGCLAERPVETSAWGEKFRRFGYANMSNVVQMEVRLLERPVWDAYINKEVWEQTDQWIIDTEEEKQDLNRKSELESNGFRVGQVIGAVPERLLNLLTSERSCLNPECLIRPLGKPIPIRLSSTMPECRFTMKRGEKPVEFEFIEATCNFHITATPTTDGKTKLHFMPRIEFGHPIPKFKPARQRSALAWTLTPEKESRSFRELSFEVTLADNEMLLIGTTMEYPTSLGFHAFVDRSAKTPVQRLLALRVRRSGITGIDAEIPQAPIEDSSRNSKSAPLAVQASNNTMRGYRR